MTGLVYKTNLALLGNVVQQPAISFTTTKAPTTFTLASIIPTTTVASLTSSPVKNTFFTVLNPPSDKVLFSAALAPKVFPIIGIDNQILPSYTSKTQFLLLSDNRLAEKHSRPNQRFSPYEELTGISSIRPEILLLANFKPIYSDDVQVSAQQNRRNDLFAPGLNEFGEFIDAQIQLQNLKHDAINKLIRDLKQSDPGVKSGLEQKELMFLSHIKSLDDKVNYLYETVSSLNVLKRMLDTRNEQFSVDYNQIVFDNFRDANIKLSTDFNDRFEKDLSFVKLLSLLGFSDFNVKGFSSTKIYLQALYEFKNIMKGYSNQLLGLDTLQQRNDTNPVTINKHTISNFNFELTKIKSQPLENIVQIRPLDILIIVNSVKSTFDDVLSGLNAPDDESKLALLFQFLAKEFNFSAAAGDKQFRTAIQTGYGYQISDDLDNEGMFDAIIGDIGNKITDRVDTFALNSLSTMAQHVINNSSVLPLETEYIDYENSVYTPGSVFLIDQILNITDKGYDVGNLNSFSFETNLHTSRLVNLIKSLNLVPKTNIPEDTTTEKFTDTLKDSKKLFDSVITSFLNNDTNEPKESIISADSIAIFNKALTDNYLKSLLFVYVTTNSIAVQSPQLVNVNDILTKEITKRLNSILGIDERVKSDSFNFSPTNRFNASPVDAVIYELQHINNFLIIFFDSFQKIFNAFTQNDLGILNHFTRYSHIQDTTLMVVVFEALLSFVNQYLGKTFTGQFVSFTQSTIGKVHYSMRLSTISNTPSINTVRSKLMQEQDLALKLSFTLLNYYRLITASSDNIIRNLQKDKSTQVLNDLLTIIEDRKMLSMIMNEQQIYMLRSALDDILYKFYDPGVTNQANIVAEQRGDGRDDVTIIDDSLINEKSRSALYAFFAQDQYLSKRGHNIRLLSVGIPNGFSKKLRESVKLTSVNNKSFNHKQLDVIKINTYKTDVEYQDLIFQPQSQLFELNRYVVKNEKKFKPVSVTANLSQILKSIPTRGYSFTADRLKVKEGGAADAFSAAEYNFLTVDQKTEIAINHVSSYLFEIYIKLLTGMSVSEFDFYVQDDHISEKNMDPFVVEQLVNDRSLSNFKLPFSKDPNISIDPFLKSVPQIINSGPGVVRGASSIQGLEQIPQNKLDTANQNTILITEFSLMRTMYSDNENESKRIFTPKMFERIFNIAVDPDDFIINLDETLKTPSGKELFMKLLRTGRIVSDEGPGVVFPTVGVLRGNYKLVERDRGQGDLVFEKYFVTIDTVLESEI